MKELEKELDSLRGQNDLMVNHYRADNLLSNRFKRV